MTDAAAMAAQVVDIQNDRLHKGSIKITLHVPTEAGAQLNAMLGKWPSYTNPIPVALATLNETHVGTVDSGGANAPAVRKPVAPEKRLAQRAGILCSDPQFHAFLEQTYLPAGNTCKSEETAAEIVRMYCEVKSRSEIVPGTKAGDLFDEILGKYTIWNIGYEYV